MERETEGRVSRRKAGREKEKEEAGVGFMNLAYSGTQAILSDVYIYHGLT